ncbi:hypothetical protein HMN09_00980100 [Mycena chlorophos]|uniref:Oxidase ustYa n=1 Tax=Mycena chlorophos TaxID=658473 RepID=A0A8H6SK18_MYCCL|nr:hypothetical protein HMN09_00980100 [Mycena chlorophos]
MARLPTFTALQITWAGLLLSLCLNLSTIFKLRQRAQLCIPGGSSHLQLEDDSAFSYVGDDYPSQLPLSIPSIALEVEDSENYGLSNFNSYADWRSTDLFPKSNGFVHLGPEGRTFGLAMFHQMHCLQRIREALVQGDPGHHTRHCLNLLRQTVLCASDTTLDPMNREHGTDGLGVVHVCRDWRKVYSFVAQNQLEHANKTGGW